MQRKIKGGNESQCTEAFIVGIKALEDRDSKESGYPILGKDTPSYRHQKVVATSNRGREMAKTGYAEVQASKNYFLG